jgi:hypothetical protein
MSYVDDVARAVRREHATKQRLVARCSRLPISFGMDASDVAAMSAKELAHAVLLKLGYDQVNDPILALNSWLDGKDSNSAGGHNARPFAGMGAGMDAAATPQWLKDYLKE